MKTRFTHTRPRTSDGQDHAITVIPAEVANAVAQYIEPSLSQRIAELENRLVGLLPSSAMAKAVESELRDTRSELHRRFPDVFGPRTAVQARIQQHRRPTPPSVGTVGWHKVDGKWQYGIPKAAAPTINLTIQGRVGNVQRAVARLQAIPIPINPTLLGIQTEDKDFRGMTR